MREWARLKAAVGFHNRPRRTSPLRRLKICLALFLVTMGTGLQGDGAPSAHAQSYPSKPVRIIVPFSAGSAPDVIARLLADQLQPKWGQAVIVESRLGASGNAGAEQVALSEPDGHTLLLSSPPPLAINRFLFKSMPFKPSDLAILTIVASAPNVLVAKRDLPVSSISELASYAKGGTTKLNYASAGRGTTPHLTMEWLMSELNLAFVHVPYPKGLAPAINDLLGGHVDLLFANLSDVRTHVQSGNIKALAVASRAPVAALPGIPTVAQSVPGFFSEAWYAVAVPSATPGAVVAKISSDIGVVLTAPVVKDRLNTLSLTAVGSSPKEASTFVEEESRRWGRLAEKIKLMPE